MRQLATVFVLLALFQPAEPAEAAPSNGVIRGRALNGATGGPQPGVVMVLTQTRRDGSGRRTFEDRTDAEGRYRFEGLPTGDRLLYALDARYDGGLFAGRLLTIPEQEPAPVIDTRLEVWKTTSDPRAVILARDDLFVRPANGGLSVIESVTVANLTNFAYIGRAASMSDSAVEPGPAASLGFALPVDGECRPAECGIVASEPIDIPQIVRRDYGFAATVAIPPGRSQITYSYRVEGSGGSFDLSRTALYPTAETSIYATEPIELDSARLLPDGERTIGDASYRVWSSREGIDAGDQIGAVAVAQAGLSAALVGGVGAALLALLAASAYALRRRQRGSQTPAEPRLRSRDEIVRRIAELDLAFDAGGLERERWQTERLRLKGMLSEETESEETEPVP
jgi:hypothetical protein